MKFPIRYLAISIAVLLTAGLPATSNAQENGNGFYASLSGIYLLSTNVTGSETSNGVTASGLRMGSGFGVSAAVGYGAPAGLRAEVELGWRSIPYDKVDFKLGGTSLKNVSVDGNVRILMVMANGIYAFDTGQVRPYVGAGIGVAFLNASITGIGGISVGKVSTNSTEFAYQALAGIAYPVSEAAEVRLGYRYAKTSDYGSHNIEAGILFRF